MTAAPRVFISYSWSSKTIVEKVIELSTRLRENGVEVIMDIWYLKEGQDKYNFMEQMVKDPTIDKVLIMCDKSYADKADDRKGGVGDETAIISPKVYEETSQEKFIPVVLEKDGNGKPYKPVYLSSRIHFDLSNDETYEDEYERILRNLHQMPEHKMPPVGKIPEWLKSETTNLGPLNRLCNTISGMSNIDEQKLKIYCQKIIDVYRGVLEEFITQTEISDIGLMTLGMEKFIPLRNAYVDIFRTLCETGKSEMSLFANDFVCDCQSALLESSPNLLTSEMREAIDFIIWEMVLCIVAILFHYQQYSEIYRFATGTFILKSFGNKCAPIEAIGIWGLRPAFQLLRKKAADILIKRVYRPIITRDSLVLADLLLYQIIVSEQELFDYWFPLTYVYADNNNLLEFQKLISKKRCITFMPILGSSTIEEFKEALERAAVKEPRLLFSNDFLHHAKRITDVVPIHKIASLP